jgi:hypothetical protein
MNYKIMTKKGFGHTDTISIIVGKLKSCTPKIVRFPSVIKSFVVDDIIL